VFVEWIADLFSARPASQTKHVAAGQRVRATASLDPVPHL